MGYCVRKAKTMLKRKLQHILTEIVPRVHGRSALPPPYFSPILTDLYRHSPTTPLPPYSSLTRRTTPPESTMPKQIHSISHTRRPVSTFTHLWILDNFRTYLDDPDPMIRLQSGTFSFPSAPDSSAMEWQLICYPKGNYGGISGAMNLQLEYVRGPKDVKAVAKFYIVATGDDEDSSSELEVSTDPAICFYRPGNHSRPHSSGTVRHETILNMLGRRDRVRIMVKISIMEDPVTEFVRSKTAGTLFDDPLTHQKTDSSNLQKDMSRLFESGHLADVNLRVNYDPVYGLGTDSTAKPESESFMAHVLVLAARSPVFDAMLTGTGDNREKRSKRIVIKDFRPSTIRDMLQFMYSGRVNDSGDLIDLFRVADKYDIADLRRILEAKLAAAISSENAAEILLMADSRRSVGLRRRALDFIARYADEVIGSDGWSKYVACEPRLVTDVVRATAAFA